MKQVSSRSPHLHHASLHYMLHSTSSCNPESGADSKLKKGGYHAHIHAVVGLAQVVFTARVNV
jgi:hypothetical protein